MELVNGYLQCKFFLKSSNICFTNKRQVHLLYACTINPFTIITWSLFDFALSYSISMMHKHFDYFRSLSRHLHTLYFTHKHTYYNKNGTQSGVQNCLALECKQEIYIGQTLESKTSAQYEEQTINECKPSTIIIIIIMMKSKL